MRDKEEGVMKLTQIGRWRVVLFLGRRPRRVVGVGTEPVQSVIQQRIGTDTGNASDARTQRRVQPRLLLQEAVDLEPVGSSPVAGSALGHSDQEAFAEAARLAWRSVLLVDDALAAVLAVTDGCHIAVRTAEEWLQSNSIASLSIRLNSSAPTRLGGNRLDWYWVVPLSVRLQPFNRSVDHPKQLNQLRKLKWTGITMYYCATEKSDAVDSMIRSFNILIRSLIVGWGGYD